MSLPQMKTHRWYQVLYNFIAARRIQSNDLDLRHVHNLTVMVLSTGILMWAYAVLAQHEISSPVPGVVGYVCSLIHLLSPLLFRFTNRHFLICNIAIGAGFIHQTTFSYYTGGFQSVIPIWYAVLPLLAGIISGRKGIITWAVITFLMTGTFLVLDQRGYPFPNLITKDGHYLSLLFIKLGFIMISSVVTYIYVVLVQNAEAQLVAQRIKIDGLFKVLFHDLANPLGRLGIGLSVMKKEQQESGQKPNRGLEIISQATESMMDITQNVRKIYAISKGKVDVDLVPTYLNEAVEYLQNVFGHELAQKNLTLEYDFAKNSKIRVLVEPVSFKNQILANILSNAIKFSHPGGKIIIRAQELKSSLCEVEIEDEGVGIPGTLLPQLFDIDKKTNRPGTNGEKGTGFGLQIMKSFIEMYGGAVNVKSKVRDEKNSKTGTIITLTLGC